MSNQIYTQDWQSYEVETIKNDLHHYKSCIEYVPNKFLGIQWTKHDKTWIEEFIVEEESKAICLAKLISMILPFEVLRIIKGYWLQSYYCPRIENMSIRLELSFKGYLNQVVLEREVFVMGDVFFPRCRGFCIKCGEPARKPPPLKIGQMIKYQLHSRLIHLMRLCYGCCQLGFDYSEDTGLEFPTKLKSKQLRTYSYSCAYPKVISDLHFCH